jgi:hypothetical protein
MIAQPEDKQLNELEELTRTDAYAAWQKDEGVNVIRDFAFDDLHRAGAGRLAAQGRPRSRHQHPQRHHDQ